MLRSGELAKHVGTSVKRVFTGYALSFGAAFILGALAGIKEKTFGWYKGIFEFMRHVPPLSLIALLILWFGIGETTKLIIIFLATFFPMFLSIKKGIGSCDPKLLEVGKIFRFSKWKRFTKIILPNAIPDIVVGMRIGLGYAWRAIIGAEMVAASAGLGYFIIDAQQMSRSDKIIVGIVFIGLTGFLTDLLFQLMLKRFNWGGDQN